MGVAYSEQNTSATAANAAGLFVAAKAASFTVAQSDYPSIAAKVMYAVTNAGATTATLPPNASVPIPVGTQILIAQGVTGNCTITAGSGVTLDVTSGAALVAAGTVRRAVKTDTNTWKLF